jgi:hypothetical protein
MGRLHAAEWEPCMNHKLIVLIFALLAGLMLHTSTYAADAAQYNAALAKAQETLAEAEKKVQLWSTSEILLKDAEKSAADGDFDLATKLATEARLQGELAVATAEREKKIWQINVPE